MNDTKINFRCTQEEKDLLTSLSSQIKISKSDYLRHLINNRETPIIREERKVEQEKEAEFTKALADSYYALGKVGVNLNQIAHYFNLEHLKALEASEPTIAALLLLDRLNTSDICFIRANLAELVLTISNLKELIEKLAQKTQNE